MKYLLIAVVLLGGCEARWTKARPPKEQTELKIKLVDVENVDVYQDSDGWHTVIQFPNGQREILPKKVGNTGDKWKRQVYDVPGERVKPVAPEASR